MENPEINTSIRRKYELIHERKKEIMLEALFSKFYSLNIDGLIEDFNIIEHANKYKQGEIDGKDVRASERFDKWESYATEKQ